MRVVYFAVSEREGPSSRYRIHQYQDGGYFAAGGIELVIAPALANGYFRAERRTGWARMWRRAMWLSVGFGHRLLQLRHLWGADGVVIEREFFAWLPPVFEWAIRHRRRGYVLEFDDAIYLSRGRRWKYPRLVRWARAVIAGNEELASFCRQYNRHVFVVPTTVSATRYRCRAGAPEPGQSRHTAVRRDTAPLRVGWVGLAYNFFHLESIATVLAQAGQEGQAKLVVVSARPPALPFAYEFVRWNERDEADIIAGFDIGIMPLADTPFARGKCGLKLLQYMACGVASVASPVGVNNEIIEHGKNGLLATSPAAWHACLTQLMADAPLRARLGAAARQTVEGRYALELWGPRLARLYTTMFGGSFTHPEDDRRRARG